jgi:uncharacterized protein YndB with AHSA1/START domain
MSNNALIYTSYIKTTPEKLWAAITNPEFSRQYWGGHANRSSWEKGAVWQHEDTNNNDAVRVTGKVLESLPPKRLVISWFSPSNAADVSTVTFDIEALKDVVRLEVTHAEFTPDSKMREGVSNGWPLVLSSLKTYLETGAGMDVMHILVKGCGAGKEAAA